uniref:Uncharacterized protein n=1 Tax=Romanomermis culicivorax TaxID=13658 RepID=A0A915KSE2_ROMCU
MNILIVFHGLAIHCQSSAFFANNYVNMERYQYIDKGEIHAPYFAELRIYCLLSHFEQNFGIDNYCFQQVNLDLISALDQIDNSMLNKQDQKFQCPDFHRNNVN